MDKIILTNKIYKPLKRFRCMETDPLTGQPCTVTSDRRYNLERHYNTIHRRSKTSPLSSTGPPNHNPLQTNEPDSASSGQGAQSPAYIPLTRIGISPTSQTDLQQGETQSLTSNVKSTPAEFNISTTRQPYLTPEASSNSSDSSSTNQLVYTVPASTRKRKGSVIGYDRISESRRRFSVPSYPIKRSKKNPRQQKGLKWLESDGKDKFDNDLKSLLAQWGVQETHTSTCVLCPEDWSAADPMRLMDLFSTEKCPTAGSGRLTYHYADHSTAYVRAIAWFNKGHWPRKAAELDNFIGCGPYRPKDASHLCHHDDCIVHIAWEGAHINEDRKDCCARARFMRGEGDPIPKHCDQHDPPCLMQLAALTTLETYCIQFSVLRQAKGMQPKEMAMRPRRHRYPTFESQLPLSPCFDAVAVDPDHVNSKGSESRKKKGKPDLICTFCTRINCFSSVVGYWSHLFHKHKEIHERERLQEIRRSASLWRSYWDQSSERRKGGQSTLTKLDQIDEKDFNWEVVIAWKFRC